MTQELDVQIAAYSIALNDNYGKLSNDNRTNELYKKMYQKFHSLKKQREKNIQYFLGFRRIEGTYNQNWSWNE